MTTPTTPLSATRVLFDMHQAVTALGPLVDSQAPATVRAGAYVIQRLRANVLSAGRQPSLDPLMGVPIVADDDLRLDEWRLLDRHGEVIQSATMWPVDVDVVGSPYLPDGFDAVMATLPGERATVIVRMDPEVAR